MLKFVTVVVALSLAVPVQAERFTPSPLIEVGPSAVEGRAVDYRGLVTGIRPDEVTAWWSQYYPEAPLKTGLMDFSSNWNGVLVEVEPFINSIAAPSFQSTESSQSNANFFFNGFGAGNQLVGYEFDTRYSGENLPKYEEVVAALTKKYGEPSGTYDYGGFEKFWWSYKAGEPVEISVPLLPLFSTKPYGPEWFRSSSYRTEEYDLILEITVHQEDQSASLLRVSELEVVSMDMQKVRTGLDADLQSLQEEGDRLVKLRDEARAAAPSVEVQF